MPAKPRKRKASRRRATTVARRATTRRKHHRRNPTRIVMFGAPRKNRKRSKGRSHRPRRHHSAKRRNPAFFGTSATPMKMAEYIAGGLIGVTINRAILPMLPATITGNNMFATAAAFAIAIGEWWLGNLIGKDFGSAMGFGALMNAGSQALNTFIPAVGAQVSLSGLRGRGVGDLVASQPGLPFWASAAQMGSAYPGMSAAYPRVYGY